MAVKGGQRRTRTHERDDRASGNDSQTQPFDVAVGTWARYSAYDLAGGYLRPAPGAVLERYDPWAEYRAARYGPVKHLAPYEEFLGVADALGQVSRSVAFPKICPPSVEGKAELLSWCERFGLPGTLLHITHAAHLYPRWRSWAEVLEDPVLGPLQLRHARLRPQAMSDHLHAVQRRLVFESGGWVEHLHRPNGPELDSLDEDGEPLQPTLLSDDLRPGVIVNSIQGEWGWEPLGKTWGRFFPEVAAQDVETFQYPVPMSDEFWNLYGEPVEVMFTATAAFQAAVAGVMSVARTWSQDPVTRFTTMAARRLLNCFVGSTRPMLAIDERGAMRQQWVNSSLLGMFGLMAIQDLTEGRRILHCARCSRIFVTSAYQSQYCSSTCGRTVQKRRYRQRQRGRESGTATRGSDGLREASDELP
jgi:hypothetical protein